MRDGETLSSERLAVSTDAERVGLTGWIIDRVLGTAADIDEDEARHLIAELCARGPVAINAERRLEATLAGAEVWRRRKPK